MHLYDSLPGVVTNERVERSPDGSGLAIATMWVPGFTGTTTVRWDRQGKIIYSRVITRSESDGSISDRTYDPATGWRPGPADDNPGTDGNTPAQQELADWLWSRHQVGRHTPQSSNPHGPVYVNPGDPDLVATYSGPSIWHYVDRRGLVSNPDPNSAQGGGRVPTEEAWYLMIEDIKKGGTPGPKPPEPDR